MEPLLPEYTYHIYNHSNGDELLFREDKNHVYFLEKYRKYIIPVADTFSYCLMPNHFHVLIRVKEIKEIASSLNQHSLAKFRELKTVKEKEIFVSLFTSKQFSNFFSSYTQAFNKMYNRKGSLFIKNFKRKQIENEEYLKKIINYIHFNPVRHGFVSKPEGWDLSSYTILISDEPTWLKREVVISWFGDLENFKYCHERDMDFDDF